MPIKLLVVEVLNRDIVPALLEAYPACSFLPYSGEAWCTFANKNARKELALAALAEHLGILVKEIAAFGDDFNDVEMLRLCGAGVAMENAVPKAKAAAKFICDTNDNDGVAHWIEENLL